MSLVPVTDSLSNREEHVVEIAKRVGRGRKRDIFTLVYRGKAKIKSVSKIAADLGLTDKQVLDAGIDLVTAHVIGDTVVAGRKAYCQLDHVKPIRDRILKLAGNADAIGRVVTKRSPRIPDNLFKRTPSSWGVSTRARSAKKTAAVRHRIAMLIASPIGHSAIAVSLEAREIEDERLRARAGKAFEIKIYPAAKTDSLISALNDFQPHILHFSGHGGSKAILLDNESINDTGGITVDLSILARLLKTAVIRPKLLVLNACDTVDGAKCLLDAVDVVIAMSDSIPDSAAYSYSRRFYAALFSGLAVSKAHEQASAALAIDDALVASIPQVLSAANINAATLQFD